MGGAPGRLAGETTGYAPLSGPNIKKRELILVGPKYATVTREGGLFWGRRRIRIVATVPGLWA